jgi:5-formyltetrahydrofolate cyclo-ligase
MMPNNALQNPASKQQLRKAYIARRQQLSPDAYQRLNAQLLQQWQKLSFSHVAYLHTYLPITARHEPDTLLLINWLAANHPHIKLVHPQSNFADSSMKHFVANANLQLAVNQWGINEPIAGDELTNLHLIDVVLVPLLVADSRGYRVGYGKGFYDRFLPQCKPGTQFIGLSFFEPIERIADIDAFDAPLTQLITPTQIIRF